MIDRRTFIASATVAAATSMSARSYARVMGANDRLNIAVMGLNGRGTAMSKAIAGTPNCRIASLIDVDATVLAKRAGELGKVIDPAAKLIADYRRALDNRQIDVLVVTTPDHWHVKASIDALGAGKHVYVEKPLGIAPAEGEALVAAQKRSGLIVQMGNQQRSGRETIALAQLVQAGAIGEVYRAETWYANKRGTIGRAQPAAVPPTLNWELWQGPRPRKPFRTNLVHYNWHWYWEYGTGEITNNALHELDVSRMMMGVGYPEKVTAQGSRQFFRDDDWEMYDTLDLVLHYPGGRTITWNGHSCNAMRRFGRDRGVLLLGTAGSAIVDRNGYEIFELSGALRSKVDAAALSATTNTVGAGDLDFRHFGNFADTIRGLGAGQASPVDEGNISTNLCHLGNMAYRTGETLLVDSATGRPHNAAAMKYWAVDYEPGWSI
ncbi:Gfo/Idh/MocA family oxidoreductase [Novosphingobium sp.]|uniref:Gfo/Idh/MocA family protein n=1 Tax=Novosphingobium sp. TaxID=1874826 RepID=UPI002628A393|nr:Gfo/Idh/MocA family oxidoreductase [Novosphingobium sp.]